MEITHKCLSRRTTWEYRHIYVRIAGFWQRVFFSNLTTFECSHRRDAITYTRDVFYSKCKRPHRVTWKFQTYTLEINTIIWHCKRNSVSFEHGCIHIIILFADVCLFPNIGELRNRTKGMWPDLFLGDECKYLITPQSQWGSAKSTLRWGWVPNKAPTHYELPM